MKPPHLFAQRKSSSGPLREKDTAHAGTWCPWPTTQTLELEDVKKKSALRYKLVPIGLQS